MSLLSLLFALAVERSLPSKIWQFSFYFNKVLAFAKQFKLLKSPVDNIFSAALFIIIPTIAVALALAFVKGTIFELAFLCLVLLICIGCSFTRESYKCYLQAAFRGELTTCDLHYQQLIQDKKLPDMGFGQVLIWLNFRHYIAVMLLFVCFGLPAVVLYRMLLTVTEYQANDDEQVNEDVKQKLATILFWIDWPMVRLVSFFYMLVGHFSKALPVWLESCFDFGKQPYQILTSVAKESEDFQLDPGDCTAEPCLLVRLAKRALLLLLAIVAVLTITGVVN